MLQLVDGVPELCVLGVPNLSWKQLQSKSDRSHVARISVPSQDCQDCIRKNNVASAAALTPNLDAGCLFYAARRYGAYCRRLSDPWESTVHRASRVSLVADP